MEINGIDGRKKERRIERRLSGARREPAPRLPQRAPLFAASPANARAFAPQSSSRKRGRRRMMVVETPGGRVTRRPRGVSGERERGARAPGLGPCVRAREPVVTYRARDRSHTLRAFARSGPWAGERAGGPTRGRDANGQTRRTWASSPSSSPSPSPDGFSKTSAPALAPAARDAPRSSPTRRHLFFVP